MKTQNQTINSHFIRNSQCYSQKLDNYFSLRLKEQLQILIEKNRKINLETKIIPFPYK